MPRQKYTGHLVLFIVEYTGILFLYYCTNPVIFIVRILIDALTDCTSERGVTAGLREAVGALRVPWLSMCVCQTLLDLYDDILLPASLQCPPLQLTLTIIVSKGGKSGPLI